MLSPYRVIDLTDERGQLAGAMLAMLGAEVIAVEPVGGSPSRALGPFAGDIEHPDRSLQHWAYNRGKRSVVLDLAGSAADRDEFRRLSTSPTCSSTRPFPGRGRTSDSESPT